ncbi:hypothetical protein RhiirC2_726334 [Rhizophagus irregularis]|uniref:Uncharacterized protein n=1 Tax=Rhizophagus irregularis TaxID=588596 RepID=A0A2N1P0T8_9GLOM|nr:hypothetical protein RhiirC2_726334 [Rhizophagus irregularis]
MTVFNNFNGLCTNPKIINSNYDDGGFLYTCYKQDTASIVWTSYSAPSIIDGTIKEKYSGEVGNITRYDLTYMFPTEGRGYAIVNGFLSNTQSTLSQWVVLANFITNDGQTKGTFVIFSQSTETSAIKSIPRCNIAYQLYGYSCILYIESTEKTFINIDFTSKGAVLNSQMFNVSQLNNNNQLYDVRNLWKGGECFVITEQLDQNVRGYVYSNDGIYNNTWNLPDTYTNTSKIFGIFPDNTVWAIATGSSIAANQWITVYSTALTTYSTVQGDTGYGSYSILSTVPERNAVIKPGLNQITIAYVMSNIEPSTGYITISQKNPNGIGNDFVRTKIPASSSPSGTTNNANNVTINGSLVTVKLEDYIFDRGNATYVVKIDDDFVEVNGQNLIGGSWQVSTEPGSGKNEPGGTRSSILLTPDGTKNYLEIKKKDDVKTYVNGLSDEISRALAIEKGRIFIPYERYQYNRNTREDQILLRVDVKDTNMPDQPSSNALRNSLDKSVLSKGTSSIPIGPYTESLDSTYGSPESPHLWKRYRYILIGVIIGLFLLILFALIARKKFQGGRNFFTIVVFPLILVDFVLDIIVLAVHGRDLKWFFICGWVFFLVPILFNIIISWFLIDYQLNHSKPTEHWWKENPRTALGFTLLSCIDLEALNVVSSRCAGYNALNARFTEKGRKRVLISILFITFIEDVPQLIIYALYQKYIVITEIIPILVLSSSCIILLFKIISFIYLMFIYKPHRTLTSTVDKIDDTNSDTASVETGGGGAPTSETTARRQAGVTELGNIGRSSETRTDDDNNDNEIKAEKAGLTKGGFLAGDIYGEKSQTSKQITEEKIVEEDSSEEETFEEKEIKYTEEQQETGEQEETTTTTTTYITEDVSGDTTEINPNTGISSSQSEVTETVTTEDGDTTTTITKTFYE